MLPTNGHEEGGFSNPDLIPGSRQGKRGGDLKDMQFCFSLLLTRILDLFKYKSISTILLLQQAGGPKFASAEYLQASRFVHHTSSNTGMRGLPRQPLTNRGRVARTRSLY